MLKEKIKPTAYHTKLMYQSDCSCQTGVELGRSALLFPCSGMPELSPERDLQRKLLS